MFDKALNYVLSYPKTERQVRQWLQQKGANADEIRDITQKLKDYGYINDEGYARLFVEQQQSKQGRGAILTKMYQKGLAREIIEANTAEIDEAIQRDLAVGLAQKWMQGRPNSEWRKLFGYLMRKGFDIEMVRDVVSRYKHGGDYEDWD